MATTATHNSSKVSREHNRRNEKFIENELKKEQELKGTQHIDTDRPHENWIDRDPREVYEEEFGASVQEYNKGKKPSRQIKDYYQKICNDEKKHPIYEMIVGVYGADCPPEVGKAIVKEFIDGWPERNPNLILAGAYWHEDERNENLNGHCHADYIPKGTDCKLGPKVGVSLTQALKEMGFVDKGRQTAQMQWQEREKQVLERICHEHGITTERAKEKVAHQEKEAYIAQQELKKAQAATRQEEDRRDQAKREADAYEQQAALNKAKTHSEAEKVEGIFKQILDKMPERGMFGQIKQGNTKDSLSVHRNLYEAFKEGLDEVREHVRTIERADLVREDAQQLMRNQEKLIEQRAQELFEAMAQELERTRAETIQLNEQARADLARAEKAKNKQYDIIKKMAQEIGEEAVKAAKPKDLEEWLRDNHRGVLAEFEVYADRVQDMARGRIHSKLAELTREERER